MIKRLLSHVGRFLISLAVGSNCAIPTENYSVLMTDIINFVNQIETAAFLIYIAIIIGFIGYLLLLAAYLWAERSRGKDDDRHN